MKYINKNLFSTSMVNICLHRFLIIEFGYLNSTEVEFK